MKELLNVVGPCGSLQVVADVSINGIGGENILAKGDIIARDNVSRLLEDCQEILG
jgi:hypothetical protein